MKDTCAVPKCRRPMAILYGDKRTPVCLKHWDDLCDNVKGPRLRKVLGLEKVKHD